MFVKMNYSHLLVAVLLVPFFSSWISAFCLSRRRLVKFIYGLTVLSETALVLCLLTGFSNANAILYKTGNWSYPIGISFYLNNQSAMMLLPIVCGYLISAIGFIKTTYLPLSVMPLTSLIFGGLVGLVICDDFFNCYVFMEVSSIAAYVLVSFNKDKRASYKVAFDYLVTGSIAGMIVLLGILMIYAATGTLSMIVLQDVITNKMHLLPYNADRLLKYGYITMVVGFALKAGFYPMHTWMIKTYTVSAPAITSFLSSSVTKVYVFLSYKLSMVYFGNESTETLVANMGNIIVLASLVGIITMGLSNLGERNIRKEIAISSMIQVCYFMLGMFTFNSLSLTGVMLQMVGHSISVATLFLLMDSSFYSVDSTYAPRTTGEVPKYFLSKSKLTIITSSALLLTTAGYPATIGFAGKWIFLEGVAFGYGFYHFALLLVGGLIGMAYVWRIIDRLAFFNHDHDAIATKAKQFATPKFVSAMALLAVIALGQFALTEHFVQAGNFRGYYFNMKVLKK